MKLWILCLLVTLACVMAKPEDNLLTRIAKKIVSHTAGHPIIGHAASTFDKIKS